MLRNLFGCQGTVAVLVHAFEKYAGFSFGSFTRATLSGVSFATLTCCQKLLGGNFTVVVLVELAEALPAIAGLFPGNSLVAIRIDLGHQAAPVRSAFLAITFLLFAFGIDKANRKK